VVVDDLNGDLAGLEIVTKSVAAALASGAEVVQHARDLRIGRLLERVLLRFVRGVQDEVRYLFGHRPLLDLPQPAHPAPAMLIAARRTATVSQSNRYPPATCDDVLLA